MKPLDYILAALERKYGPIVISQSNAEHCPNFIYDDDCDWGCKGNAMGN